MMFKKELVFKDGNSFNNMPILKIIESETPLKGPSDDIKHLYFQTQAKIDHVPTQRWYYYRNLANDYEFEPRKGCINRAFYKIWEILQVFQHLLPSDTEFTCHLAEAPGSFVQVVQSKNSGLKSIAVSKASEPNKDIPTFSDVILKQNGVVCLYSDLCKKTELLNFIIKAIQFSERKKFMFITADGGIDEGAAFEKKEELHYSLILNEIIAALLLQRIGGHFVIKFFDCFNMFTIDLMYLLYLHYEKFEIYKPITSRPTNSERYIICSGFKGCQMTSTNLLNLVETPITNNSRLNTATPLKFTNYISSVNNDICKRQIISINNVLKMINERHVYDYKKRRSFKRKKYQQWKEKYKCNV